MRSQKVVSDTQFGILVAYMEKNKDFAMFRLRSSSALEKRRYGEQWEKLAFKLNSVGATKKTPAKWKNFWNEKKYLIRKKAFDLKTKGGKLTLLEKRVLNICGQMTVAIVRMPVQNGTARSLRPKAPQLQTTGIASTSTDSPPPLSTQKPQTVDAMTSPLSPYKPLSYSSSSSDYSPPRFRKCTCEYCSEIYEPSPTAVDQPQASKCSVQATLEAESGSASCKRVAIANSSKRVFTTYSPASPSSPPPQPVHYMPVVDSRTPPVSEPSQDAQDSGMNENYEERCLHLIRENEEALKEIVTEVNRGCNAMIDCCNTMSAIQTRALTIESYMASTAHSLARIEMVLESAMELLRRGHELDHTYYRE